MPLKESDILDLPDAPDFISKPPKYPLAEMIKLCEAMLPHWNRLRLLNPPPAYTGGEFRWEDLPARNENTPR